MFFEKRISDPAVHQLADPMRESDAADARRPPVPEQCSSIKTAQEDDERTYPAGSSRGKLFCDDPASLSWYTCPATTERNGGSSERSSEGCRPVRGASRRSVAALAPGRSVEQEQASKFQKQGRLCAIRAAPWLKENLMNPNIDFLGICQLLKALRTVGFSETEIKKIARRIAVELGANFTLYA